MFTNRFVPIILAALLAGLSFGPAIADVTELNVLGPDRDFPRVSRSYPSMDATFVRPGFKRSLTQIRQVQIGSSKQQLVRAIGKPVSAYADGSWNFNLALRLPQGNRLVCQYRVYFDASDRVSGTVWRRPQCVDIATGNEN